MSPRTGATVALLAFVAASVGYLVAGVAGRDSSPDGAEPAADGGPGASRVVAYYFHATMRCPTCLAIENGAHAALEDAFAAELASGALEWRSVNMEQPENERFVTAFGLTASSLVLVRETGGEVMDWRNLEDVWELVGDDARFGTYVVEGAREFLGAS